MYPRTVSSAALPIGSMTIRYAIFFCPDPASDLYRLGADWLGYDAGTGAVTVPDLPGGLDIEEWRQATDAPRRYGFHATLKPPFRLARDTDPALLVHALGRFAAARAPVDAGRLALTDLDGFLALTLPDPAPGVAALAAACVADFDAFRAPADEAELARRRAAGLTPAQGENLRRWGYPYVMAEFRFHMALTGRLDGARRDRFRGILAERCAPVIDRPLEVGSLCLFVQPSAESRFELLQRFLLGG